MDNDPNRENALTTNPITNLTANKPIFSTHSQSKPYQNNDTNEQLADILSQLANTLNANQTSRPNTNSRELKPTFLTLSVALSLTSLIIFYSNVAYISTLTQCNLIQTLQKSTL